jgi:hypothetical protein
VKLLSTADRVISINAAQIITVEIAANRPNAHVVKKFIIAAFMS